MNTYRYDINKASIDTPRSLFRIPHNYKTTFNAGQLIPVYCSEVLPGQTESVNISAVVRELTLMNPVMDNSYIQFDAFFVPMRIIWDKTKQFFGENETGVWTQNIEYEMPCGSIDLENENNSCRAGSLGDYFGLPVSTHQTTFTASDSYKVNYLPLRAYYEIYNYYYLNEATQQYILYSKGNNINFGSSDFIDSKFEITSGYSAFPLCVNRFSDLFTSALPQPQKGNNVLFLNEYLPVIPVDNLPLGISSVSENLNGSSLRWGSLDGSTSFTQSGSLGFFNGKTGIDIDNGYGTTFDGVPNNLYASTIASGLRDINSLRIAIATQHLYEALARGGSRYNEYLLNIFGVHSPAETLNIPQYLGSVKKLINVNQVVATTENADAVLGTTGGMSHTVLSNEKLCTGSHTEHGYFLILAHVRTDNTYSQGIPKLFTKKSKFDLYNPLFSAIGNVPIKNREIFAFLDSDDTDRTEEVFGYAEAWYEYKSKPNLLTGYMRPYLQDSFYTWTYGRYFDETPTLSEAFVLQDEIEVNRTIAVQSNISNQFKLDLFVDSKVSLPMPLYSIPGLTRI